MSRFKPSREDLSENPPTPEHLLRGFHGRPIQKVTKWVLPLDDFSNAQCLGRSDTIFYLSDKRDPKDPKGEGAQGFMKRFYHEQHPEAYLYVIPIYSDLDSFLTQLVEECKAEGVTRKARRKGLYPKGKVPSKLVELGVLEKVMLSIGGGEVELSFQGYSLFVFGNMKTLMALPISSGRLQKNHIYIWASQKTRVNWRGIID